MRITGRYRDNDTDNTRYREGVENPYPGFYRGRVEDKADPLRLGRVKVRIPQLHGVPEINSDAYTVEELPWARRVNFGQAGFDIGDFVIPHVGSYIWVGFEEGDPDKIIYFGGVYGRDSKKPHPMGILDDRSEDLVPAGRWGAPLGKNEVPQDIFENKNKDEPTVDVVHKSLKGHTITNENEDEKESLSIIDRVGQIFKFVGPVLDPINHADFQRKVNNAIKENCFDIMSEIVQSKSVIIIKDALNQIFRMVAEWGKEKIEIVTRNRLVNRKQGTPETRQTAFQLNSGDGNINYLLLSEDIEKDNRVYIKADATNLELNLVVVEGGTEVSKIELNTEGINQFTTGNIDERAGHIHLNSFPFNPAGDSTTWNDEQDEKFVD